MPEINADGGQHSSENSFRGLYDNTSFQDALEHNQALHQRSVAFNASLNEVRKDAQGLRTLVFENNSPENLNSGELMKAFTAFRDMKAVEDMQRLYDASNNAEFKQAPMVREYLAVAYNKANRPDEAIRVGTELLRDAENPDYPYREYISEPEVNAVIAKAYVMKGDHNMAQEYYQRGFEVAYDYYPGINAAYESLALGNVEQAQETAKLVQMAAMRDGGLESRDYWCTTTMLESACLAGSDPKDIQKALDTLLSYDIKDFEKDATLGALKDRVIPALEKLQADGNGQMAGVLDNVRNVVSALEDYTAPVKTQGAATSAEEALLRDSYTSRGISGWDTEVVMGNARFGGAVPDIATSRYDRVEFAKLLDVPLNEFMEKVGGNIEALPAEVRNGQSLSDIKDPRLFVDAAQAMVRANFDTVGKRLEVIDSPEHKIYHDHPTESLDALSGSPNAKLHTDPDVQNVARQQRRTADFHTSSSIEFCKGLGDCRHHANAMQTLFNTWQREQMDQSLNQAGEALKAGDQIGYERAIKQFDNQLSTELRVFDVKVIAPVAMDEKYKPQRPIDADGDITRSERFVPDSKPNVVEDHTMTFLVERTPEGGVKKMEFADAFYQQTYEWGKGEVDLSQISLEDGRIQLPGGMLRNVANDNGVVPVTLVATAYAGHRELPASGDIGTHAWERGLPVMGIDTLEIINQRAEVTEKLQNISSEAAPLLGIKPIPQFATVASNELGATRDIDQPVSKFITQEQALEFARNNPDQLTTAYTAGKRLYIGVEISDLPAGESFSYLNPKDAPKAELGDDGVTRITILDGEPLETVKAGLKNLGQDFTVLPKGEWDNTVKIEVSGLNAEQAQGLIRGIDYTSQTVKNATPEGLANVIQAAVTDAQASEILEYWKDQGRTQQDYKNLVEKIAEIQVRDGATIGDVYDDKASKMANNRLVSGSEVAEAGGFAGDGNYVRGQTEVRILASENYVLEGAGSRGDQYVNGKGILVFELDKEGNISGVRSSAADHATSNGNFLDADGKALTTLDSVKYVDPQMPSSAVDFHAQAKAILSENPHAYGPNRGPSGSLIYTLGNELGDDGLPRFNPDNPKQPEIYYAMIATNRTGIEVITPPSGSIDLITDIPLGTEEPNRVTLSKLNTKDLEHALTTLQQIENIKFDIPKGASADQLSELLVAKLLETKHPVTIEDPVIAGIREGNEECCDAATKKSLIDPEFHSLDVVSKRAVQAAEGGRKLTDKQQLLYDLNEITTLDDITKVLDTKMQTIEKASQGLVVAGVADAADLSLQNDTKIDPSSGKPVYERGQFVTLAEMREQLATAISDAKQLADPEQRNFAREELVATGDRLRQISQIEARIVGRMEEQGIQSIQSTARGETPLQPTRTVLASQLPEGSPAALSFEEGATTIKARVTGQQMQNPSQQQADSKMSSGERLSKENDLKLKIANAFGLSGDTALRAAQGRSLGQALGELEVTASFLATGSTSSLKLDSNNAEQINAAIELVAQNTYGQDTTAAKVKLIGLTPKPTVMQNPSQQQQARDMRGGATPSESRVTIDLPNEGTAKNIMQKLYDGGISSSYNQTPEGMWQVSFSADSQMPGHASLVLAEAGLQQHQLKQVKDGHFEIKLKYGELAWHDLLVEGPGPKVTMLARDETTARAIAYELQNNNMAVSHHQSPDGQWRVSVLGGNEQLAEIQKIYADASRFPPYGLEVVQAGELPQMQNPSQQQQARDMRGGRPSEVTSIEAQHEWVYSKTNGIMATSLEGLSTQQRDMLVARMDYVQAVHPDFEYVIRQSGTLGGEVLQIADSQLAKELIPEANRISVADYKARAEQAKIDSANRTKAPEAMVRKLEYVLSPEQVAQLRAAQEKRGPSSPAPKAEPVADNVDLTPPTNIEQGPNAVMMTAEEKQRMFEQEAGKPQQMQNPSQQQQARDMRGDSTAQDFVANPSGKTALEYLKQAAIDSEKSGDLSRMDRALETVIEKLPPSEAFVVIHEARSNILSSPIIDDAMHDRILATTKHAANERVDLPLQEKLGRMGLRHSVVGQEGNHTVYELDTSKNLAGRDDITSALHSLKRDHYARNPGSSFTVQMEYAGEQLSLNLNEPPSITQSRLKLAEQGVSSLEYRNGKISIETGRHAVSDRLLNELAQQSVDGAVTIKTSINGRPETYVAPASKEFSGADIAQVRSTLTAVGHTYVKHDTVYVVGDAETLAKTQMTLAKQGIPSRMGVNEFGNPELNLPRSSLTFSADYKSIVPDNLPKSATELPDHIRASYKPTADAPSNSYSLRADAREAGSILLKDSVRLRSEADISNPHVGRAYGVAGILNRAGSMNEDGVSNLDKASLALDTVGLSTSATGNAAGLLGAGVGIVSDTVKGYEAGGIEEAAYRGGKSTANTVVAAEILAPGSTVAQFRQLKDLPGAIRNIIPAAKTGFEALKNGTTLTQTITAIKSSKDAMTLSNMAQFGNAAGNFAGKLALVESALTTVNDTIDYTTGRKELTTDNVAGTALDTMVAFDPLKPVARLAGYENVSIYRGVDIAMGQFGWTEGKGEDISQIKNETQAIYKKEQERFQAGELDPSLRAQSTNDPNRPQMTDYKHLGAMRHQIAKYIPDGKIDGHDVSLDFDKIDMTKTDNYMAYKMGMNRMMVEQEKIKIENSSYIPRWIRSGKGAEKFNEAESQLNLLGAAEKEFGMFENKVISYRREKEATEGLANAQSAAGQAVNGRDRYPVEHAGNNGSLPREDLGQQQTSIPQEQLASNLAR